MKLNAHELSGPVLDWFVAKGSIYDEGWLLRQLENPNPQTRAIPRFSTDWEQGGPIIEAEGINTSVDLRDSPAGDSMERVGWKACCWNNSVPGSAGFMQWATGPTPLVAAMRLYVSYRLGNELEVPDGLI